MMRPHGSSAGHRAGALVAALIVALASAASAFEYDFGDGRGIQVHGAYEMQLRTLSDGYRAGRWYLSQFSHILNVEAELDIAPDGFLFFDYVTGFVRVEGRINCVFKNACGPDVNYSLYGNGADRQKRNFRDGQRRGYSGTIDRPEDRERIHNNQGELVDFTGLLPFGELTDVGADPDILAEVTAPFIDARFAARKIDHDNPRGPRYLPQGPWQTSYDLENIGTTDDVRNFTNPADPDLTDDDHRGGLLLRPWLPSLYAPSNALVEEADEFDSFDQKFSENDMFFNHGASQDEGELKEAYLDLEMFDSRLWLRLGKQSIVWGKTELFRTTDQLNPQDIAISSLPSLEESRISLWSARGVWSFYNVGPFEDVRLEGAVILDDFEPTDLGFCGEPYTPFLVCGKNFGLFAHGVLGTGLAGEERPPNWWDDPSGLEFGARLEWRWNRFSFAIVDFWGYSDFPYVDRINTFERAVDPKTGRPLDSRGHGYDTRGIGDPTVDDIEYLSLRDQADFLGDDALAASYQGYVDARDDLRTQAKDFNSGNRQIFDFICGLTVGIASAALENPAVDEACIIDVLNNVSDLGLTGNVPTSAADALTMILAGSGAGSFLGAILAGGTEVPLIRLNQDLDDRPADYNPANPPTCNDGFFNLIAGADSPCLSDYLTDEQEALLGCGPFYGSNCDKHGIDLYNAEFSVLGQRLPNIEPDAPVGSRVFFEDGRRNYKILRGARRLTDPRWNPRFDGCVRPDPGPGNRISAKESLCTGARTQDLYSMGFDSELEALSQNFVNLLAALSSATGGDDECVIDDPATCQLVRAVAAISGVQRPEISARRNAQFGRRDFVYHGGGEAVLKYNKRNVLGFSMDFAEDVTKTNWSFEFTWIENERFGSLVTESGNERVDLYNFTVSIDRATFINFLNPNRTFFFNTQWFMRVVEDWDDDRYSADGPVTVLGTFTVATAYFQDRLAPAVTVVHDFSSASGGVISQISYRYTEAFSIAFGMATFYGGPRRQPIPYYPLAIGNEAPPYNQRAKYQGLSAISERDEFFMRLRYTF
ncbi:MAG: DUF1302 family protein [Myxococcota bacterium]